MNQPTNYEQQELLSLDSDGKDIVMIQGTKKKYQIGWMKGYTLERLSKLELEEGYQEGVPDSNKVIEHRSKFLSKAASLCILNGLKIYFLHCFFGDTSIIGKDTVSTNSNPLYSLLKKEYRQSVGTQLFYQSRQ